MKKMKSITNEVLLEKMKGLENLIDEKFAENKREHLAIIVQTTKTNGTVTLHDRWINRSQGTILIASSIILPIILYLLYLHIK
jgi:hypothetical protein